MVKELQPPLSTFEKKNPRNLTPTSISKPTSTSKWLCPNRKPLLINTYIVFIFLQKKQLSDGEVKDVLSTFSKGQKHTCRVIDFDFMDNVAIVSLKQ